MDEVRTSGRPLVASAPPPLSRFGGVRADFVAALGRRVAELASLTSKLEADPRSAVLLDDLRRRTHALAAGARLLQFNQLAERLCNSEALLLIAADRKATLPEDIAAMRTVFEQAQALAWGDANGEAPTPKPARAESSLPPPRSRPAPTRTPARETQAQRPVLDRRAEPASAPPAPEVRPQPVLDPVHVQLGAPQDVPEIEAEDLQTVLVVGSAHLGAALAPGGAASPFEVERAEDGARAIDLARALAPDVIVLDADIVGARELCEALLSDPLTEATPIVVVGGWARPEDAAPFVALGAARALVKPVSPSILRKACLDATAVYGRGEIRRLPLGEVNVDDLGARLAEELRRGLCDAALAQGREARFELGEGSDVLAALWGAVARIRDIVTIQSSGHVRFAPTGPEGALPIAPWIGDAPRVGESLLGSKVATDRRAGLLGESRAGESSLRDRVALVVDDDPAITWFLAGVLRAEGAIVHEAHDGARALEIAYRVAPEVVISDIVMPVLDGFALCRALKRDLALRDVPVILLSWKEDLLQRVRELGAGADGYMRKETSAPVILQRVREVTRGRSRVEQRLAAGGEVRGRLDGLTPRTLLKLACAVRPDSTVTLRDATHLYEVDLRGGRPARATRTSVDGCFARGSEVLASLLALGAGRFVVAPAAGEPLSGNLGGTLDEQLLPHLANARAALRLLSGASLVSIERVDLDEERLEDFSEATPEPARTLLRTIAAGASPRALVTSGQASARLLEDVLAMAAARGAVCGVCGTNGDDVFAAAVARETEILHGTHVSRPPVTMPELDLGPIMYTSTPAPVEIAATLAASSPRPAYAALPLSAMPTPPPPGAASPTPRSVAPVAEVPRAAQVAHVAQVPQVPRLAPVRVARAAPAHLDTTPLGPEARLELPVLSTVELHAAPPAQTSAQAPGAVEARAPARPAVRADAPARLPASLGSLSPPPVESLLPDDAPARPAAPASASRAGSVVERVDETPSRTVRRPSAFAAREPAAAAPEVVKPKDTTAPNRSMWALFAVAGIVFAVGARLSRERELARTTAQQPAVAATAPATPGIDTPAAATTATAAPAPAPADLKADGESKGDPILPQDGPLRADDKVPPGQGMLEIVAGTSDTIFIDGTHVGNGPIVKRALAPKKEPYEIRVKLRGEDRVRFAVIKDARLTRIRIAPPWSR
jgi:DNA-binding response OmpR family regulator